MDKKNKSMDDLENIDEQCQEKPENESSRNEQDIFEERYNTLINEFSDACERNSIEIAVAILVNPKTNQPYVYLHHGLLYDSAKILATVLRQMKETINADLFTE